MQPSLLFNPPGFLEGKDKRKTSNSSWHCQRYLHCPQYSGHPLHRAAEAEIVLLTHLESRN